jgi:type IV secretion system protein VirB11
MSVVSAPPERETQRSRLVERMKRDCGSVIMEALADDTVNELMLNPDGRLWLDIAGKGMIDTGTLISSAQAESILSVSATLLDTVLTRDNPIVEGEFPIDGSRLEGLMPPIVARPTFAIRKRARSVFKLDDYIERGILTEARCAGLRYGVETHRNILVVGGTGSGKTTLTNAILGEIARACPDDRLVAIEDTQELQVTVANHVLQRTSETVTMQRLLRATMRLRPDRIVIGEVRGGESFTLLKAWNSGHPGGVTTIHADSAVDGLAKLADYIHENPDAGNLTSEHIGRMISKAVHMVVFIEKISEAPWRRVSEVCRVSGFSGGEFQLLPL